jgi:hypothetical protein
LGRRSDCFLGSVIPASPRPFRFWVAKTLVPVAMISGLQKTMGASIRRLWRDEKVHGVFLLPLALAAFTSRSFCGVTIEVTPGLSTLRVARPLLYLKVLRWERFPLSFGLPS